MADKMRTPKINWESMGTDAAKVKECIRRLLGNFERMTAQLAKFVDFCTEPQDLSDKEKAERGTKMATLLSNLESLDSLTNFLNGYFDDEDLDRIRLLRSLRGKKKTKP